MNNQSFVWQSSEQVREEIDELSTTNTYPVDKNDIPNLLVIIAGQLVRIADYLEEGRK